MDEERRLELADRFLDSFRTAVGSTRAIFRNEVERHGVTWPQYGLLRTVKRHGPVTVTELSGLLNTATPTTSKMVDGLCRKGLLERTGDPGDQRVTRLEVTNRSSNLLKKINKQQREMVRDALEGSELQEMETFARLMDLVAGYMREQTSKRAKPPGAG